MAFETAMDLKSQEGDSHEDGNTFEDEDEELVTTAGDDEEDDEDEEDLISFHNLEDEADNHGSGF